MLSFSLVAEALTGLIYHRPSGENSKFAKQSLSGFKSCEYTHFDHLLRSATLLHFMTMEYITSYKGGRKLAFGNNIYMKQKVLSNGTVWGDIMGGVCPEGFCLGGFCQRGDFVQGDFVRGILSGGGLSGGFCPRTITLTSNHIPPGLLQGFSFPGIEAFSFEFCS